MYTTVSINVPTKEPLSQDVIAMIKDQIGQQGAENFIDITADKISFRGTLNHGYNKTLALLIFIESYVHSDSVIQIGELETEAIEDYRPIINLFESRIVFDWEQRQNAMYAEIVTHTLRDLHGNERTWDDEDFLLTNAIETFSRQSIIPIERKR